MAHLPRFKLVIAANGQPLVQWLHETTQQYHSGPYYHHAQLIVKHIRRCVRQRDWDRGRWITRRAGNRSVSVHKKFVRIGCQVFTHQEIFDFAHQQGWW